MRRIVSTASLFFITSSLSACVGGENPVPGTPGAGTTLFSPEWTFEPWISKDISDGPDTYNFVAGFQERDIPVGVVVLDSPWETNYNTFIVNEERYPNFAGMLQDLKDDDIRLVLWITQMVNTSSFDLESGGDVYRGESENFAEGFDNGYFVNGGEVDFWWKGQGAGVDFFNDAAVTWWRDQQTALLELGINGWKLDFGEQYLSEPIETAQGTKTLQEYSEKYYEDFLEHGLATREGGVEEFVTMVRPYDESYGFVPRFYARREHAPVAWVGDQFQSWEGLNDGLDHIFRSAAAGYAMVGSDIGGYLDNNIGQGIPFDVEVFNRWTAMSALTPFFQLHGRANLAPWTVETEDPAQVDETVAAYRYWATLHHQMVPFWFSLTYEANRDATGVLHPVGDDATAWTGDWRAFVGEALLMAPLHEPGPSRDVVLPENPRGVGYIDWWDLAGPVQNAGTTVAFTAPGLREMPLFVLEGAIVPLHADGDATGFGSVDAGDALTLLLFPGPAPTTFSLWEKTAADTAEGARSETTIELVRGAADVTVTLSRAEQPVIARVRTVGVVDAASATASVGGATVAVVESRAALDAAQEGVFRDVDGGAVWVKAAAPAGELVIRVE